MHGKLRAYAYKNNTISEINKCSLGPRHQYTNPNIQMGMLFPAAYSMPSFTI